jgi:excisionase family DNA binding protein
MTNLKVIESSGGLLTPQQAADFLGIKLSTIYSMCMRRQIPFCKIGRLNRFRVSDLNKWVDEHIQRGLGQ